jgi:galactonate dehydratase
MGFSALKWDPFGSVYLEMNRRERHETIEIVEAVRDAVGPDIALMLDVHGRLNVPTAIAMCNELARFDLAWIEEPTPPENPLAYRSVRSATHLPIATGERLVASYSCRELIELGVVDILQTDINHVGGITALWKVAAMAEASGISMAPHACEGPIGGLATVHVDAATPNFLVQEICSGVQPEMKEKVWEEWLGFPAMRMVDGRFPLPEKPGLGFDLTEEALKKYPFGGGERGERQQLNGGWGEVRRRDGTVIKQ